METVADYENRSEAISFLEKNYTAGNWLFTNIIEYVAKQPGANKKDILSDLLDEVYPGDQEKILALLSDIRE